MSTTVLRSRLADRLHTGRRVLRNMLNPTSTARPVVTVPAPSADKPAPDPAGLFAADELPPLADIEAAAAKFLDATEQARAADRVKRASRKLLDRLPAGRYGLWNVSLVDNAREVADLDAIRAIFAANGLGDVPMKPCAASLKVEFAPMAESVLIGAPRAASDGTLS